MVKGLIQQFWLFVPTVACSWDFRSFNPAASQAYPILCLQSPEVNQHVYLVCVDR
jgi:hypothetical protein